MALLVGTVWIFCGLIAYAGLTVSLAPAVQNSVRGQTLVFSGTLTNTSTTAQLFLNDIQFQLAGDAATCLRPDSNTFFANVPGILLPGESYTGEVFSVALGANAPSGDYLGTVTLLGGVDIPAADSLASAAFTVLWPAVTIAATDANASELGPDAGAFTIMRTGGTDFDLTVSFSIDGTAVNGATYQTITAPAIIAAGSSSKTISITPIPDNVAQGNRTVTLTLASSTYYNLGAGISSTVIIHDKPADEWRIQNFGASANDPQAADGADWNSDGILNLTAYALNMDPKNADRSALPSIAILSDYLTLSYVPNAAAIDAQFAVEASTDLVHWSTSDVDTVSDPDPNPPGRVTFRYVSPVSSADRAFLRLKVTRVGGE